MQEILSPITIESLLNTLAIEKNEIVFISSDITQLAWLFHENDVEFTPDILIEAIQERLGANGTLIFPTYNWDFCHDVPFTYKKTRCKTGSLGSAALKRNDFKRTQHPLYSFAVWGKDKDLLCGFNNKSSFGIDSPFAYMHKSNIKNILFGVDYLHSFTYVHYVEQQVGKLTYRYLKSFYGDYIDENEITTKREYEMLVRDLDLDVQTTINPIGELLEAQGVSQKKFFNGISIISLRMGDAFPIIEQDIITNKSRKVCKYIGQDKS